MAGSVIISAQNVYGNTDLYILINGTNNDDFDVYCNSTDTCYIVCESNHSCTNLHLYCYGYCFVDCSYSYTYSNNYTRTLNYGTKCPQNEDNTSYTIYTHSYNTPTPTHVDTLDYNLSSSSYLSSLPSEEKPGKSNDNIIVITVSICILIFFICVW